MGKLWKRLTRLIPRQILRYRAYRALIKDDRSYLHTTGWIETLRRGYPCRPDGSQLPWMNYSVIGFLERRLTRELSVFEYGSGYSTFFFARLVDQVLSVEHDQGWYDKIKGDVPPNVRLVFTPLDRDGDYCRTIQRENTSYDVVVVDGRDRVNCIKQCLCRLSPRGVILLDDSRRTEYIPGIEFAADHGFSTLDLEGLTPTGRISEQTSILYRPNNCLKI